MAYRAGLAQKVIFSHRLQKKKKDLTFPVEVCRKLFTLFFFFLWEENKFPQSCLCGCVRTFTELECEMCGQTDIRSTNKSDCKTGRQWVCILLEHCQVLCSDELQSVLHTWFIYSRLVLISLTPANAQYPPSHTASPGYLLTLNLQWAHLNMPSGLGGKKQVQIWCADKEEDI